MHYIFQTKGNIYCRKLSLRAIKQLIKLKYSLNDFLFHLFIPDK